MLLRPVLVVHVRGAAFVGGIPRRHESFRSLSALASSSQQQQQIHILKSKKFETRALLLQPFVPARHLSSEPSFHSLGLAHAYPSGWLQSLMETLHIDAGMPWWGTIMASE